MSEARITKFDDSIFDTLSDVSSSDVEQESIANSSIVEAENNKRLEDVQVDFNVNENSSATSILNQGNSSQIEESLSITTPPRRALKRRHVKNSKVGCEIALSRDGGNDALIYFGASMMVLKWIKKCVPRLRGLWTHDRIFQGVQVVCLRGMNILGFEKGGGTTVGGQSVVVTPPRLFLPPALHSCVMPDFKFVRPKPLPNSISYGCHRHCHDTQSILLILPTHTHQLTSPTHRSQLH
nr:expressed protein [Hymenolepis microstoma]